MFDYKSFYLLIIMTDIIVYTCTLYIQYRLLSVLQKQYYYTVLYKIEYTSLLVLILLYKLYLKIYFIIGEMYM